MSQKPKFAAIAFGLAIGLAGAANAAWQPAKPIEFIATAGPGGGTDNFARAIQNIITIHKLVEQPIVVTNKGGGSGAEGYTYTKAMAGDPYKIVFGTSNAWTQPMVSKVAYNYTDLTPIAAMVQDEFLLWVKQDAPYQNVQDFLKAVAAKPPGDFKMGGAQSKDTDETLTRMIDKGGEGKIHLHSLQERRRGCGATGRRPYRLPHQQSQRKHWTVEGQHPAPAVRLQPAASS